MEPHAALEIVDALTVNQLSDATELVVEYMAATFDEVGLPVPTPPELPEDWRREVADVAAAYPPPGTFLVAYRRLLMDQLHRRAANSGIRRVVLDVLTSRTHAIEFYRRLGYTDAEPFTEVPVPVIFMELLLR